MTIKILGPEGIKSHTLQRRIIEVLSEMKLQANVQKVEDLDSIIEYGVIRAPGLVIDGKLIWQGIVPTKQKVKQLLESAIVGRGK